MSKRYTVNIMSKSSIEKLQKDLRKYRNHLKFNARNIAKKLSEIGLKVAEAKVGESPLGNYIHLAVDYDKLPSGGRTMLIATGEVKESDEYAPFNILLAVEFGAGIYYNKDRNPKADEFGLGPGTFPGQIHAFEDGWYYWDEEEQTWRYTHGVKATMPMYNADMAILSSIEKVAREVFK